MIDLPPTAKRARQQLVMAGRKGLPANSSRDTLDGLRWLRDRGLAYWNKSRRRWLEPSYAVQMLRELLLAGPYEGEDFFRVKATGSSETKWFNVTPEQLAKIAEVLDDGTP